MLAQQRADLLDQPLGIAEHQPLLAPRRLDGRSRPGPELLQQAVVQPERVIERVHFVIVRTPIQLVSFETSTASICSSRMRHLRPSISVSGRVRLGRADVDVGATVTTEPMKLVAVTTTA